eukprot:5675753-Prymnesium_polylepis.1
MHETLKEVGGEDYLFRCGLLKEGDEETPTNVGRRLGGWIRLTFEMVELPKHANPLQGKVKQGETCGAVSFTGLKPVESKSRFDEGNARCVISVKSTGPSILRWSSMQRSRLGKLER